jgi:hypothetical protein
MATVRRKMGLDMGHLDGRAHETKRKSPRGMDELFRNIGTEKTDGNLFLWKIREDFSISGRSDRLDFF